MSTLSGAKKKMGRPTVDSVAINVRIERDMLDRLDKWIAAQPEPLSRPEAIRRIMTRLWDHETLRAEIRG